ncbi:MAG: hypothetical protein HOV80_03465 [Polyangiaceae bacterium]|nr:hypothetical protein [Polyangiaceae bacterium]
MKRALLLLLLSACGSETKTTAPSSSAAAAASSGARAGTSASAAASATALPTGFKERVQELTRRFGPADSTSPSALWKEQRKDKALIEARKGKPIIVVGNVVSLEKGERGSFLILGDVVSPFSDPRPPKQPNPTFDKLREFVHVYLQADDPLTVKWASEAKQTGLVSVRCQQFDGHRVLPPGGAESAIEAGSCYLLTAPEAPIEDAAPSGSGR